MKRKLLLFAAVVVATVQLLGQNFNDVRCGHNAYMDYLMQDPDFQNEFMQRQAELQQKYMESASQLAPCTNPLIIPVAVHYQTNAGTLNSQTNAAQVQCMVDAAQAQVAQMNLDFSNCNGNIGDFCTWTNTCLDELNGNCPGGCNPMPEDGACMVFCLGDTNLPGGEDNLGGFAVTYGDYTGNGQSTGGTWSGYLNIYVADLAGGVLGFAPLGGGANPNGNDGVSVLSSAFGSVTAGTGFSGCNGIGTGAPFNGGATCTHEVGHYFGLDHTFENGGGNAICDVPTQNNPNYGNVTFNTGNCTSSVGTDYSGNFMDYVDDVAMFMFTQEQVTIMLNTAAGQGSWATTSCSNGAQLANDYSSCYENPNCTGCQEAVACDGLAITVEDAVCDAAGGTFTATFTYTVSGTATFADYTVTNNNPAATLLSGSTTSSGAGTFTLTYSLNSGDGIQFTVTADAESTCTLTGTNLSAFCAAPECPAYNPATTDVTEICNGGDVIVSYTANCAITPAQIEICITFDNWPEETSWDVTDSNGASVGSAAAGTYTGQNGATVCETVNADPNETYTFTISDTYGDGMSGGTCFNNALGDGSYTITDVVSGTILVNNEAFEGNASCDGGLVSESQTGLTATGTPVSTETIEVFVDGTSIGTIPNDPGCEDDGFVVTLVTDNICTPEVRALSYTITCDETGAQVQSESFNITVFPTPPADVADLVTIDYSGAACGSCAPVITYNNDCDATTVTVTETTAANNDASGNAEYDVVFVGANAGACCADNLVSVSSASSTGVGSDAQGTCVPNQAGSTDTFTFSGLPALSTGTITASGAGSIDEVCFNITASTGGDDTDFAVIFETSDGVVGPAVYVGAVFGGTGAGDTTPGGDTTVDVCIDGATLLAAGFDYSGYNPSDLQLTILDANCAFGGATDYTLNSATVSFLESDGTSNCDFTVSAPYNCECTATCTLTDAGLVDGGCDDAGTPTDSADDTFTFSLNPVGASLGTNYTISNAGSTITGSGNYGGGTTFGPFNITTVGSGAQMITITDGTDPNCSITVMVTVPDVCSTDCASVDNLGTASGPQCSGENFSITGFSGTTTGNQDAFILVYDEDITDADPTDTDIYNHLIYGNVAGLNSFGEIIDGAGNGLGTPPSVDLSDIIGYTVNSCDPFTVNIYYAPFDNTNGYVDFNCAVAGPVAVTFYPNYQVNVAGNGTCTPSATLDVVDANGVVTITCATAGDASLQCAADEAYDFSADVAAGTPAACISGSLTGTLTCPLPTIDIVGGTITCDNPTVTLDASASTGGDTFSWTAGTTGVIDSGEDTAMPVVSASDIYVLTYSSTASGCSVSSNIFVDEDTTPPTAFAGDDVSVCTGQPATLTATGGGTYLWSNGATLPTVTVGAGTFTVTVTDTNNGCQATDEVIVSNYPVTPDEDETYNGCIGDGYNVVINGNTYDENNPTGTETVQDANGCDYNINVNLTFVTCTDPCDSAQDINESASLCPGDTYVSPTSGTSYTASGTETVTDANGCDVTLTVTITDLVPQDANEDVTLCPGESYTSATTGTVYTASGTETFTDANGCDATLTVTITTETPLDVVEDFDLCDGDVYTSPTTGTSYTVSGSETFTDANGCEATLTVTINNIDCSVPTIENNPDIVDPCACDDANNIDLDGDGQPDLFYETVVITSDAGETWTDDGSSVGILDASGNPAAPVFTEYTDAYGVTTYTANFYHSPTFDTSLNGGNGGFEGSFTNGTETLTTSNFCAACCAPPNPGVIECND